MPWAEGLWAVCSPRSKAARQVDREKRCMGGERHLKELGPLEHRQPEGPCRGSSPMTSLASSLPSHLLLGLPIG